jgi:hypothetical protein
MAKQNPNQALLTLPAEILERLHKVLVNSFSRTVCLIMERAKVEKWNISYNRQNPSKSENSGQKSIYISPELLEFTPPVGSKSFRIYCVLAHYCENIDALGLPVPTNPA